MISAENLTKRELLSYPDPIAEVVVDSDQHYNTQPSKKTTSPYWNEEFQM